MANQPSFLFYANDFDAKTKFFTHEQVGIYLRLLIAQFQHGHLTDKQVVQVCGVVDKEVMEKFTVDADGKYFNERLDAEKEKRYNFSESRRRNVASRYESTSVPTSLPSYVDTSVEDMKVHMNLHMDNDNDNDNSINTIHKKSKNFKIPTIDEVKAYCIERKNQVDADKWLDYYTSNGWKVGKNPMKDWKAAIRTWEKSQFSQATSVLSQKPARVDKAPPALYKAE